MIKNYQNYKVTWNLTVEIKFKHGQERKKKKSEINEGLSKTR